MGKKDETRLILVSSRSNGSYSAWPDKDIDEVIAELTARLNFDRADSHYEIAEVVVKRQVRVSKIVEVKEIKV